MESRSKRNTTERDYRERKRIKVKTTVTEPSNNKKEEDVNEQLKQLLKEIKELKDPNDKEYLLSTLFLDRPSKKLYPDYYKVIKQPIALSDMQNKLNQKGYQSLDQFKADIELMASNAKTYNEPGSQVYEDALQIQKYVDSWQPKRERAVLKLPGEAFNTKTIKAIKLKAVDKHKPSSNMVALMEAISKKDQKKAIDIFEQDKELDPNELVETEMFGDKFTWSPIHAAAYGGHVKLMPHLMERGGNVELHDTWHSATPLGWAAFGDRDKMVKLLVQKYHANVNAKNKHGQVPFDVVSDQSDQRWNGLFLSAENKKKKNNSNNNNNKISGLTSASDSVASAVPTPTKLTTTVVNPTQIHIHKSNLIQPQPNNNSNINNNNNNNTITTSSSLSSKTSTSTTKPTTISLKPTNISTNDIAPTPIAINTPTIAPAKVIATIPIVPALNNNNSNNTPITTNNVNSSAEAMMDLDPSQPSKKRRGRPPKSETDALNVRPTQEIDISTFDPVAFEIELFNAIRTHTDNTHRLYSELFEDLPNRNEYPDYYKVIQQPRSFGEIAEKMQTRQYRHLNDWMTDMKLVFENAMSYNEPGSRIFRDAKLLLRLLHRLKERMLIKLAIPVSQEEEVMTMDLMSRPFDASLLSEDKRKMRRFTGQQQHHKSRTQSIEPQEQNHNLINNPYLIQPQQPLQQQQILLQQQLLLQQQQKQPQQILMNPATSSSSSSTIPIPVSATTSSSSAVVPAVTSAQVAAIATAAAAAAAAGAGGVPGGTTVPAGQIPIMPVPFLPVLPLPPPSSSSSTTAPLPPNILFDPMMMMAAAAMMNNNNNNNNDIMGPHDPSSAISPLSTESYKLIKEQGRCLDRLQLLSSNNNFQLSIDCHLVGHSVTVPGDIETITIKPQLSDDEQRKRFSIMIFHNNIKLNPQQDNTVWITTPLVKGMNVIKVSVTVNLTQPDSNLPDFKSQLYHVFVQQSW